MSYLQESSVNQLRTLLSLFPIKHIKKEWDDLNGNKSDIIIEIAGKRDFERYSAFFHENIGVCKQHIYLFNTDIDVKTFSKAEFDSIMKLNSSLSDDSFKITYLAKFAIEIIVSEPLQKIPTEYLIPLQIELFNNYLIVKFIKFERNLGLSGFDSSKIFLKRQNHEANFLKSIEQVFQQANVELRTSDLHKGIKHLWDIDYFDASVASFKTQTSTDKKTMDEKKGLKKHNQKAYEENIKDAPLFGCLFETVVSDGEKPITFTCDSSKGFISFNRYLDSTQESEDVVKKIIQNN